MSKSNKPKKPIYKRVWPYILLVCLIGAGAGGAASSDNDEDRGEFAEQRTVITITPEPGEKDTFSVADIVEETPEPLELLEPETTQTPVTRSAPEVPQPVEETTQEITEEPAEEPAEEITQDPAEEVPAEEQELERVSYSDGLYRTPSGKRYHKSKACAGENAIPCTLEEASSLGLTLCDTCKDY